MSKLDDELAKDENLWRMWREEGVTETIPLAVDFYFYAVKKVAAEQIADFLGNCGLARVEIKSTRIFLILRGWEISGVEEGTWSLEKLQDRSRRYVRLAEIWNATYDGCGALIDPAKIQSSAS